MYGNFYPEIIYKGLIFLAEFSRQQIGNAVYLTKVTDKHFKTNQITIHFYTDFDDSSKLTRADYALAAYLLSDSCWKYRTYAAMSRRLMGLYKSTLTSGTNFALTGARHTYLHAGFLDNRFALGKENIESEMCKLLRECILDPNASDGLFDGAETELMRSELIDTINSVINDKSEYARENAAKTAFRGEPQELSPNGTREQAELVNSQTAFAAYKNLLDTAHVEIVCAGCSDFSAAEEEMFQTFFEINRRTMINAPKAAPSPLKAAPEYVSDTLPMMNQAILRMYFKAPDLTDRFANQILTLILGGLPTSRFFTNIREKKSLCYYCSAMARFDRKYLTAYAGVEPKNLKKTEKAILKEISDIAERGVTDEELETANLYIRNSMRAVYDTPETLSSWYTSQLHNDRILSPEEAEGELSRVTSGRIRAAARLYKLDTVYSLSGGDE